jgi:hypothetical protein
MKKEDMVVGREYLNADKGDKNLYVYKRQGRVSSGHFEDEDGYLYQILYSRMTEAPEAKPEFEFDDEIEASDFEDFKEGVPARFLADSRHCSNYVDSRSQYNIVVLDEDGDICEYKYARKVKVDPMVEVMQAGICMYYKIPKSLMDKIIAGEFS